MGASTMLNRVSKLVSIGYGEELDKDLRSRLLIHEVALPIVKHR